MSDSAAEKKISGIHHVTAITADAQKNIDFYCGVLGLRLVKLTVAPFVHKPLRFRDVGLSF